MLGLVGAGSREPLIGAARQQVLCWGAARALNLNRVHPVVKVFDGADAHGLGHTPTQCVVRIAGHQARVGLVPDFSELTHLLPGVVVAGVLGEPRLGVVAQRGSVLRADAPVAVLSRFCRNSSVLARG